MSLALRLYPQPPINMRVANRTTILPNEGGKDELLQYSFDRAQVLGFRHITRIGRNYYMVPTLESSAQSAGRL